MQAVFKKFCELIGHLKEVQTFVFIHQQFTILHLFKRTFQYNALDMPCNSNEYASVFHKVTAVSKYNHCVQ